ncbi:MAG: hypothetical protein DMF81_19240 [Acidobacteria bacterium]|nr:MAG: hypothetical protein DMF81_19240 [Acidobacteriota bacterium]
MVHLALALVSTVSVPPTQPSPPSPAAPEPSRALLERAIAAAGGSERLERYPVLEWRAKATVHAARTVAIQGRWQVQPPERAVVETTDATGDAASARKMILDGERGWGQRGDQTQPLTPEAVSHERDQFYLYYLMRLVPLRSSEFHLQSLDPDAAGRAGFRVSHPGRRDVDLYFDETGRLARMVTRVAAPGTGREVVEELRLSGTMEAQGIRWPQRIEITWDGRPYFEFELTEFKPLRRVDESIFKGPS